MNASKKILISAIGILTFGMGGLMAQPIPPPPGGTPPPPPQSFQTPPPPSPIPPQSPGPSVSPPPPGWGAPGCLVNPPTADWMNQGSLNVMATGYDTESVLVQIPLNVSYTYNGVQYNVTVVNCWNPYTQNWTLGIDTPAYQTDYYFNGFNYNYYVNLPTGTFYFNL